VLHDRFLLNSQTPTFWKEFIKDMWWLVNGMLRQSIECLPVVLCLASNLVSQTSATAIIDINVVDVTRGEIHYGQTVVIAGGHIQAIAPSGDAQIPGNALQVQGEGR